MKTKLLKACALGLIGVFGLTSVASCQEGQTEVVTYTVTFNSNGGTEVTSKSVNEGSTLGTLPTSTKDGFTLEGWYTDEALTAANKVSATTVVSGNMTLYAKWTEIATYTVTFNTNGGSAVTAKTITDGQAIGTLPMSTKAGVVLEGWYTDEALTEANKVRATTVVSGNMTLYAKWIDSYNYEQFMALETGDAVIVEGFIAAKQSWYQNKANLYLVDEVGTGYYVYQLQCTEAEYNTYTIGTYIRVTGEKMIYSGEHEINSGATAEIVTTTKTMPTEAFDITNLLGNEDELLKHQNAYFTATLTVKAYNTDGDAYAFAESDATEANPKGDVYFTLTDGTNDFACCIESYLIGETTDTYQAALDLEVGSKVIVTGYLYYWSDKPNAHIVSIAPFIQYDAFMALETGDEAVIEGFVAAKQSWWENKANIYLVDEVGTGYYVYQLECTQEEYNAYTIGTYIRVTGEKMIYSGEHEINSGATAEIITTTKTMPTEAFDITTLLGDQAELLKHQNAYFTATLTVKAYNEAGDANSVSNVENPRGDVYFTLTDGTNELACCIESYLTAENTATYLAALDLEVGQSVTITGYLYYWSDKPNPHIVTITVNNNN